MKQMLILIFFFNYLSFRSIRTFISSEEHESWWRHWRNLFIINFLKNMKDGEKMGRFSSSSLLPYLRLKFFFKFFFKRKITRDACASTCDDGCTCPCLLRTKIKKNAQLTDLLDAVALKKENESQRSIRLL